MLGSLLFGACGGDPPADAPVDAQPGRLVVIGGALAADNEAIYQAVLDGRLGDGPVCVVPTASAEPTESMASAVERIDRWGGAGSAQGVLISEDAPERADDPEVAAQLRDCSGFFFTGGSQSRIVATFRPDGRATLAYEAVMGRWREGAVVAGTSAGAAMMGGRMIAGGTSMDAFEVGVGDDPEGVGVTQGMGFFEWGWLDQHFLARGRWGRLLMASLRAPPYAVGYGIDENTALVVDGGRATVAGASGVVVIDARNARGTEVVEGITLELLGTGDRIDLESLVVTPAMANIEGGASGERQEGEAGDAGDGIEAGEPSDAPDPFARWALLTDLARLTESDEAAGLDYTFGAGWRIELIPAPGFRGGAQASPGVGPLLVRITVGQPGTPG